MSCAALCAACFLSATALLDAYVFIGGNPTWTPGVSTLTIYLQFPDPPFVLSDGSLTYYRSFENALSLWNEQMRDFQFTWVEGASPSQKEGRNGSRNGFTEVSMATTIYGSKFGDGTLAVTLLNYSGRQMSETDVIFNTGSSQKFDSYRGFSGGKGSDFHRIALHELGHVLGLDHSKDSSAVMNATYSGSDHLQQDDLNGVWAPTMYGQSSSAPLTTAGNGRMANIATRVQVSTGSSVMIAGFIIQNSSKPVLIRALGPSLSASGIASPLPDPKLELHRSDSQGQDFLVASNNDWRENPAQAQAITGTGIPPQNDRESAIYANLAPGAYSAVVSGADGKSGVGLVEVYDLAQSSGKIANLATRAQVGTDADVLIGGFIVTGPQAVRVVVRAIGPSLSAYLPDYLRDPTLELRNSNGDLLQANNNWGDSGASTARSLQDLNLEPKNASESAILAELAPGNFTAIVRDANNSTGVGLVEIYDVSPTE